jgi:hypothetical protein
MTGQDRQLKGPEQQMKDSNDRAITEMNREEIALINRKDHETAPGCIALPVIKTHRVGQQQIFSNQQMIYGQQLDMADTLDDVEKILKKNGNGHPATNGRKKILKGLVEIEPITQKDLPKVIAVLMIFSMWLKSHGLWDMLIEFLRAINCK